MKLNPEFVLRSMGETTILVPFGKAQVNFNGMLTINPVGAFIIDQLKDDPTEDQLVASLIEQYEVDEPTARRDVAQFLQALRLHGALLED